MANCTKEKALEVTTKYLDREWEKIKQIEFPKTLEREITKKDLTSEVSNLIRKNVSEEGINYTRNNSKIVKYFNNSLKFANRKGSDSPYSYWQKLKSDRDLFHKFYQNRIRCSDWYKEKDNMKYIDDGYVPEQIYGIGLTTSMKAPYVSYFKPIFAKYLINKYLGEFDTVFDPFTGFGGRLLGALSLNKNYIGYDINDAVIKENSEIYEFWKEVSPNTKSTVQLVCRDSLKEDSAQEEHNCLFTCPPYGDLEQWRTLDGNLVKCDLNCDEIIDVVLKKYKCKKYVFVVDNKIQKYKNKVAEELGNFSYIKSRNKDTTNCNTAEYIVVIE